LAKIYPAPTEPPIDNGAILIHNGHILAVGPSATTKFPRHAEKLSSEQTASVLENTTLIRRRIESGGERAKDC